MSKLSVSVVSYNSGDAIVGALTSLFREVQAHDLQVYVVDNASSDNTAAAVAESFPQVTVLSLPENRGFGGGHNAVLPLLDSEYHLFLNPDVVFTYDALSPLCEWLDTHPDTVLVTPNVLNPDGTRQAVPRRLPRPQYVLARPLGEFGGIFGKWRDAYTMNGSDLTEPTDITFCTGCFMLVRTAVLREVAGFDEDFFLYCEDADLSRRLAAYGRLVCLPDVTVTHGWERGSSKNAALRKLHLQSLKRYFAKWRGREATAAPLARVSVAMASYNGAAYIEHQLRSILDQLEPEDEVVVSDDGSTDETVAIVDRLAADDRRIRRIEGPREGIVRNFENALAACTGDVIFLADQDDVWHPDKRETVLRKMRQTGAVLVLHDARVTDGDLNELHPSFFAYHGTREGYWRNLWRNGFVGCCMAFRRELLALALPMPADIPMHDQWLGLLAEKRGGVALLVEPLIDYRRHGQNATSIEGHGRLPQMLRNRTSMFRAVKARLENPDISKGEDLL